MAGIDQTGAPASGAPAREAGESPDVISIVQRGNLKMLEKTLRKQWRMGQNMVLCWSADERGVLVILVPHHFLGNYCASTESPSSQGDKEAFIRELISGQRQKSSKELLQICERLEVAPTFIKLTDALPEEHRVLEAVEELIKRYGLSYVDSRAVLLFDIVGFSLFTPFEQASQLNSLSYSLNSAYNKLLAQGIEINFARTTTGDGYYIWNRKLGPAADLDLFYFMLLVVADNAIAQAASRGNTVPAIRTGYHIGGHYELYQAEGVNPTVFSYVVGDVTIQLARMLDLAQAHQILLGDFHGSHPRRELSEQEVAAGGAPLAMPTPAYISACNRDLSDLQGVQLAGKTIDTVSCRLTAGAVTADGPEPRCFRIVDKHGLARNAYNLEIDIDREGEQLSLGLRDIDLPAPKTAPAHSDSTSAQPVAPASAEEMIDDLASLLKKRGKPTITED